LFLQTILAPTFGTNGPLWSLANEFWYYVLFPLLFLALASGDPPLRRVGYAAVAGVLCWLLPRGLVIGGAIWLFGYAAAEASARIRLASGLVRRGAIAVTGLVFAGVMAWVRAGGGAGYGDFMVGGAFAILLIGLTQVEIHHGLVRRLASGLAEMSYTLYLVHFPAAAFAVAVVLHGRRFALSVSGCAVYIGFVAGVLCYAWLVHLVFERNTAAVQKRLLNLVHGAGFSKKMPMPRPAEK
jgi:peptidoglycan/LPS O-acetylase OafA/YrhL